MGEKPKRHIYCIHVDKHALKCKHPDVGHGSWKRRMGRRNNPGLQAGEGKKKNQKDIKRKRKRKTEGHRWRDEMKKGDNEMEADGNRNDETTI